MAKYAHANLQVSFGGTVYSCLNTATVTGTIDVITAQCSAASGNAVTHNAVGATSWTASLTILLEDDAVTFETAFALGTGGAFILYPTGVNIGDKSLTWTNGFVSDTSEPMAIGDFGTMAVSFTLDEDVTRAIQS